MSEYIYISLSITFTTLSQVAQKLVADKYALGFNTKSSLVKFGLSQPLFWLALACMAVAMGYWLLVIDLMDISKAYPILSLNYAIMIFVSKFYFAEEIPITRWVGVTSIILGVFFINQS